VAQQREVELKFDIDGAGAEALKAHDLLRDQPADVEHTDTVYYDTPEGKLWKAGVTLRVRRSDDGFVQTIKADAGPAAGLFNRAEWENPVPDLQPDLGLIAGTAAEPLLRKESARVSLRPVFGAVVERRRWNIVQAKAAIELVLDQGEVIARKRRQPILELELELKRGSERALFTLVKQLAETVPLRVGVLTKSERGQLLLRKKPPAAIKAEPVALEETMSAGEAFQAIAYACIRHFRLNEPQVLAARGGDALHQSRVALRRLRSAFSIFRPLIAGAESDAIRAELSWISGVLGKARDLDVFMQKQLSGADQMLVSKLHGARERAYDEVLEALNGERFRGLMINLIAWLETGKWRRQHAQALEQPAKTFAATALDRFWRKVKKGGGALGSIGDEARHDVRIAGKKLRYAAEFFAGLHNSKKEAKRRAAFLDALEALQSDLGDLNDMATAVGLTESLGEQLGIPSAQLEASQGARNKSVLLASAEAAHGRLIEAGPFWR